MKSSQAPASFVKAIQREPVPCATEGCSGPVSVSEQTPSRERVKAFHARCERCGWTGCISGHPDSNPPWDEASLIAIIEEHLLHLEPICPYDHAPVFFQSLPNPRRRARYSITCHFCGRQAEMDWPPLEAKW